MEKLLTIVVPTYNMQAYLRRCLDSLLLPNNQLEKLEVLVINDGSKDDSSKIAHEYQTKYPTVFRVIDKENGNYGSCINVGVKEATGKYFKILDSDDWYNTEQLSQFLEKLKDIDTDAVFTNFTIVSNGGKKVYSSKNVDYGVAYSFNTFSFKASGNEQILCMHSSCFKHSLLKAIKLELQHGISYTDNEFCYYPLAAAKDFVFVDTDVYQYNVCREGQTISKEQVRKNFNHFYLIGSRMVKDYLGKSSFTKQRKEVLSVFIFNILYWMYYLGLILDKNISTEDFGKLKLIDNLVRKDKHLNVGVLKMKFHRIPFVWIWRKFHLRLSVFNFNTL